jgi:hypothetical protein
MRGRPLSYILGFSTGLPTSPCVRNDLWHVTNPTKNVTTAFVPNTAVAGPGIQSVSFDCLTAPVSVLLLCSSRL